MALATAIAAAREAGALLRADLHRPDGPRGHGDKCPADEEAEALIRDHLELAFPDHGIRGEEISARDRPARDPGHHVWLIDPNDGTSAFVEHGWRGSAVSIGLLRDGLPVLGVVFVFAAPDDHGDLLAWAEGLRFTRNGQLVARAPLPAALAPDHTVLVSQDAQRAAEPNARLVAPARFRALPSVAARLALVAAGDADACVSLHAPGDWDYCAGHALLRAVGGGLYDEAGRPVGYTRAGVSRGSRRVFGGSATVAATLAGRTWSEVFQRDHGPAHPLALDPCVPARGEICTDARRLRRAQGCLLGQLAGDALGSLVEFQVPAAILAAHPGGVRQMRDGGTWGTLAGQPTDDSELALVLARSLLAAGRYDPARVAAGYAWWLSTGPFDCGQTIGAALAPALAAWRTGGDPAAAARAGALAASQANGALMRISPLAIFGHAAGEDELAAWARNDAALTHPHPACGDASAIFVLAVRYALQSGATPGEVYDYACARARARCGDSEVAGWMDLAGREPPPVGDQQTGWVRVALQNAFFQLVHAPDVESGVVATISRGGDTDTNAAIAGALLGAVHGRDALPRAWIDRVLTCRPIAGLPGVRHPRPPALWPVDALTLAERLLVAGTRAGSPRSAC